MYFVYDGYKYPVVITRKNNKNLYIRVSEDLKVTVTCPYLYTDSVIKKLIESNNASIIRMINKQKTRSEKQNNDALLGKSINVVYKDVKRPVFDDYTLIVKDDKMKDNWYLKQAKNVFKIYLDEAYDVYDEKVPYPKLKIRRMKTRWGVCNRRDNSITLNLELIKKDQMYLNYVIVHELSHFVHFDHSNEFWNTVEKYCPEYKKVRKELRK